MVHEMLCGAHYGFACLGCMRTTILKWGEGVVEHKVYLFGNIDVHMVLACYLIMYVYSISSFQIDQHT